MNWDYRVEVVRVVDGDTVDLRVDLGFHLSSALRFRILGCDTPERSEPGWRECTKFTQNWLDFHAGSLRAQTYKADSFGRWLARIYVPGSNGKPDLVLADALNALMLSEGWTSPSVR